MNSNVCLVTFIFLSLENVAGLICSSYWPKAPRQQQQPSIEKPGNHDLEGTQNFSCASQKLIHQWHQGYQNGKATGNIPPQKGVKTTRLILKVEEFDNNTKIYCVNSNNDTSQEKPNQTWKVQVLPVSFSVKKSSSSFLNYDAFMIEVVANKARIKSEEPTILKYNEKQIVSFSCLEYNNKTEYIQLGLINTTSNMIKTYEAKSTQKIFDVTYNGTILCCIYYIVNGTEEKWITRYVANKTLLLYNDIVRQDALGENLSNIAGTDSAADTGHRTIIIILITAVAVVFILLVIIVICKKRCRKKPESDTKVLYADLDILRQIEPDSFPRPGPEEECPYAQIIGEIRPQTK